VSGALSVSLKKPPSMWGSSSSFFMSSWSCGDSGVSGEDVKLGVKVGAMVAGLQEQMNSQNGRSDVTMRQTKISTGRYYLPKHKQRKESGRCHISTTCTGDR